MGTIASVLQWTCNNCHAVNPIEIVRCSGCETVRVVSEEPPPERDEICENGNCQEEESITTAETKDKEAVRAQGTGYIEIRPDG